MEKYQFSTRPKGAALDSTQTFDLCGGGYGKPGFHLGAKRNRITLLMCSTSINHLKAMSAYKGVALGDISKVLPSLKKISKPSEYILIQEARRRQLRALKSFINGTTAI